MQRTISKRGLVYVGLGLSGIVVAILKRWPPKLRRKRLPEPEAEIHSETGRAVLINQLVELLDQLVKWFLAPGKINPWHYGRRISRNLTMQKLVIEFLVNQLNQQPGLINLAVNVRHSQWFDHVKQHASSKASREQNTIKEIVARLEDNADWRDLFDQAQVADDDLTDKDRASLYISLLEGTVASFVLILADMASQHPTFFSPRQLR